MIEYGIIQSADIVFSRGFILDCYVSLDFDGAGQSFGGWSLGGNPFDGKAVLAKHAEHANYAADFIGGVMAVAGVGKWSDLPGRVIRVERDRDGWGGKIVAIGHPVKDRWYRPEERFALLSNRGTLT